MAGWSQKKAIVIGGSRGMGKAIADELRRLGLQVEATSRKELDTADIAAMATFAQNRGKTDVLVLNTGGPPKRDFLEITPEEWEHYHRQMFLGFAVFLQQIKLADHAYVFCITSGGVKEPHPQLQLSFTYRTALTSLLKTLSRLWAAKGISIVNLAPGAIATGRLRELVSDMASLEASLVGKRIGTPEEVGRFVRAIVENDIKYLNGVTINFDGGNSTFIF